MIKLEQLQPRAAIRGVVPDALVEVVSVQWFLSEALELTYKTSAGKVANELLYRHDEQRINLVEQGRPWSFDGDGALFRLVSEAQRIRLAHLFDPVLAVHTSVVEPLPHQITAVYEAMLPRQPLRFLLADDPGAGKTIMAGLLIKELIARGDLQRCLIVCPGSLAEQWQDELYRRFHLPFEILKDRLTKEITYWDHRAEQHKVQEQAGKPNAKLNSGEARKRADNLQGRLHARLEGLKLEAQISPLPPVVLGGLLVVPVGLLAAMSGRARDASKAASPADTQASAARARAVIMEVERKLGFEPTDRELEKVGYDIESRVPGTGKLRFVEVKGRIAGAATITVTRNEILYSLNKPEDFILAIVEFVDGDTHRTHYVRQPFQREPDFGVTSVNYDFAELLARAEPPR
jgi:hypothetical protein